jgi:hypothetical protein
MEHCESGGSCGGAAALPLATHTSVRRSRSSKYSGGSPLRTSGGSEACCARSNRPSGRTAGNVCRSTAGRPCERERTSMSGFHNFFLPLISGGAAAFEVELFRHTAGRGAASEAVDA